MAHQYVRALDAPDDEAMRRYVVVAGGPDQVIGQAALWPSRPDAYRLSLMVARGWRRRGVGSRLLARMARDARAEGATTLQGLVGDAWTEALAFLRAHGFTETMRLHRLTLDVGSATLEPYRRVEPRLAGEGIMITTLDHELAHQPLCWQRIRELHAAGRAGWPGQDPQWTTGEPHRRYQAAPDECFLAVHGDRYVGFTGGPITAVHPAYRNRGIATALKVRAVDAARARGVPAIRTASGEPAMLRVAERLGFRRTASEIRLVKPLG